MSNADEAVFGIDSGFMLPRRCGEQGFGCSRVVLLLWWTPTVA